MTSWTQSISLLVAVGFVRLGAAQTTDSISFTRDVRPILSEHCFLCHGFDASQREAGLRLDQAESAISELDSGTFAIKPGNVDESELVVRIRSDDSSVMPPHEMEKPLTEKQKTILEQWIRGGAPYQQHWSFVAPESPALPTVKNLSWVKNPIDRFVLSKLEAEQIEPSAEATRAKLLRRVTLDLTGIPPTIKELDDFLADPRDDAYEQAVNRLLESRRYGEHMARHWLDAARYGDTHGMARDDERSIWPYRDWVIRAFNDNMPFDQFTVRQLAGDLIPDGTVDDKVATGFVRCNVSTAEGGSIDEELIVNYARDRVDTFATVWMGLTLGCASCHDHKYDPFSQVEYYQLVAYFNNLTEEPMNGNALAPDPVIPVPNPAQAQALRLLDRQRRALEETLESNVERHLEKDFQAWIERGSPDAFHELLKGQTSKLQPWQASKAFHRVDNTANYFDQPFPPEPSVQPEDKYREWTPLNGEQSISISDDNVARFYRRELDVSIPQTFTLKLSSDEKFWKPIRWKVWLNGELVYFKQFRQSDVPFSVNLPVHLKSGSNELLIRASHFGGPLRGKIEWQLPPNSYFESLQNAISSNSKQQPTPQQLALLKQYYEEHLWPKRLAYESSKLQLNQEQFALDAAIPVTMICEERKTLRPTYVLNRGQYDNPQQQVSRGTPKAILELSELRKPDAGGSRLDLAHWLIHDDHPLTARVAVNRLWQPLFGTGLVKTVEDFGSQGEWPSHPKLLDWLAVDFRTHGWDMKRMVYMMVTSSTYRQSSRHRDDLLKVDPKNRLLARGPAYRLDAEVIRDQALFVSGMLVEQLGGRGVKPPQPDGLWKAVSQPNSSTAHFVADPRNDQLRRSIYTFWKRTSPPPVLQTFDAPTREACMVRRERTNTPLQALALMNEEQYFEAAKGLASQIRMETDSDDARLRLGFRSVTSRVPHADELDNLHETLRRLREYYATHPGEASQMVGEIEDAEEKAAWTMTANALMNLSEAISKD